MTTASPDAAAQDGFQASTNGTEPLPSGSPGAGLPGPGAADDLVVPEVRRHPRSRSIRNGLVLAVIVAAVLVVFESRRSQQLQADGSPASEMGLGLGVSDTTEQVRLLAKGGAVHVGWVLVYVDGRVLWYPDHDPVFERRLSPGGLALVRNGSLEPNSLGPAMFSTSQADLWIDASAHEYRPTRYAVCLWNGPNQPADISALTPTTRDLLGHVPDASADHVVAESSAASEWRCLGVTAAELDQLRRLAIRQGDSVEDLTLASSTHGATVTAAIMPVMPHGKWIAWGG